RAYALEPSGRTEAQQLQERLYRSERWSDLADHLERRLEIEDLTDGERVSLIVSRARILTEKLGRGVEAIEELNDARESMPKSGEVLMATEEISPAPDPDDTRQDALARLAALVDSPRARRDLLVQRAKLLEKMGDLGASGQSLEEAVELALKDGKPPRPLVERLARIYQLAGQHASAARLWARVAGSCAAAEAGACLSRAGHIRLEMLGDRRGAMAALEAAARENESDLGIRRALLELARALGDLKKASLCAKQAAEAARA